MSKIIEDAKRQKTITHIVTSSIVGAVLVPVISKTAKPVIQRVVIPLLGPVAGTIVNAALFVAIPPAAALIGEAVASKTSPKTFTDIADFTKNVSKRAKSKRKARLGIVEENEEDFTVIDAIVEEALTEEKKQELKQEEFDNIYTNFTGLDNKAE